MMKMALRSLKKDTDRALFYWLVFFLSSMFMYIFFHLAISKAVGVTFFYGENNLPTYLTVFNVMVCMLVIFLANDFFVKKKSKELAVLLISGARYLDLVSFLFLQTGVLMCIAIPAGVLAGQLCFPLLIGIMFAGSVFQSDVQATFEAAGATAVVILFEVFWCSMINLGYSYRSTIYALLHGENTTKSKKRKKQKRQKWLAVYPIGFLLCPILFFTCNGNTQVMLFLGIAGMFCFYQMMLKLVFPILEKAGRDRWSEDAKKMLTMGFFREDLKLTEIYMMLFVAASMILSAAIAGKSGETGGQSLCILSFIMLIPLLAMSLMFRFCTETVDRRREYRILSNLGFEKEYLQEIIVKELFLLYGGIGFSAFYYIGNSLASLKVVGLVRTEVIFLELISFAFSIIVSGICSYGYYKKVLN